MALYFRALFPHLYIYSFSHSPKFYYFRYFSVCAVFFLSNGDRGILYYKILWNPAYLALNLYIYTKHPWTGPYSIPNIYSTMRHPKPLANLYYIIISTRWFKSLLFLPFSLWFLSLRLYQTWCYAADNSTNLYWYKFIIEMVVIVGKSSSLLFTQKMVTCTR